MMCGGSRFSHRLRECKYHHHQQRRLRRDTLLVSGLGFCSISQLPSFMLKFKPLPATTTTTTTITLHHQPLQRRRKVSCLSLHSKSPDEIPILSDCFSQQDDHGELPSRALSSLAGGIVALGKFDALHIGHRELAIQASKIGTPYLLSFVGIAEVLGWEPRAPIVAKCDRHRVLSSWAPYCGNAAPAEFQIEFSSVRRLTPRQFVEKLSKELGVCGVVAGENYRFGYKAAGDASELVRLCEEYGMRACIINSVMDRNQDPRSMGSSDSKERGQVSSTRVRHALAIGDMKYVSELLGRQHRLMLMLKDQKGITSTSSRWRLSASKSCLLNLPPKDGSYNKCSLLFGNENPVACRVFIDKTHIHLEMDEVGLCNCYSSQEFQLFGIEFGG